MKQSMYKMSNEIDKKSWNSRIGVEWFFSKQGGTSKVKCYASKVMQLIDIDGNKAFTESKIGLITKGFRGNITNQTIE